MNDLLENHPQATVQRTARIHFSPVWLVPICAALIAAYLGWRNYYQHGETITIAFNTADGLIINQTQIKYKAVALGTVSDITLDREHNRVLVSAHMAKSANDALTSKTRFWVVRPRFSSGSISGFETLVSGAYIQCDPGEAGGKEETHFTGLEEPPAIRLDEPGATYTIKADRLGPITTGSPLYFRDVNVGEVLHYDIGDGFGPVTITVFIRAPYNKFVRSNTRFWNTSGLTVGVGPTGLQIQLQSLQSLLTGGIAFYTRKDEKEPTDDGKKTVFKLYGNHQEAEVADMQKRISFVTYFQNSVKNIGRGSPVSIYGIQVGEVSDVVLQFDAAKSDLRAQVQFEIQPERLFSLSPKDEGDDFTIASRLVANGLRVKVDSGGIIPGQSGLSLEFVPKSKKDPARMEGKSIYMPAGPSNGLDGIMESVANVAGKLNQIPFGQIGENLNNLLATANGTLGGQDMRDTLRSLSKTMASAQELVAKANQDLTPTLERLPEISAQLQSTITHANGALNALDQHSDFQRDARRTMDQVAEAARAIRLLADFLSHHPEALIKGRDIKENP